MERITNTSTAEAAQQSAAPSSVQPDSASGNYEPLSGNISFNFPEPQSSFFAGDSVSESNFSIDAQGTGTFTGLSYTVPAYTKGTIRAEIQVMAITSADLASLNEMIMGMLDASKQEEVNTHKEVNASADCSLIGSFFGGGASADYQKTKSEMTSLGLTEEQITSIIDYMFELASKMSNVVIEFEIDNSANDFSVSGDLQLYTISGDITSSNETAEYRFLSNEGTAGNGSAPAQGNIIELE